MAEANSPDEEVYLMALDLTKLKAINEFYLKNKRFCTTVAEIRELGEQILKDAQEAIRAVRKDYANIGEALNMANSQADKVIRANNKNHRHRQAIERTWGETLEPEQLATKGQHMKQSGKEEAANDSADKAMVDADAQALTFRAHVEATEGLYNCLVDTLNVMKAKAETFADTIIPVMDELKIRIEILNGNEPDKVNDRPTPPVKEMLRYRKDLVKARDGLNKVVKPFFVQLVIRISSEMSAYTTFLDILDRLKDLADSYDDVHEED
ncbi:hypothetical protein IWX49DRAFT_600245 [Phyllosticta citricarpa]|uniref:Uncharacterized protein n=2 Tax=Phyllosticta TaxID=121621 RepID=A0ABR1M7C2_9PEZI